MLYTDDGNIYAQQLEEEEVGTGDETAEEESLVPPEDEEAAE